mmetsp:Transcript_58314/g.104087  ORF Transcript_58314/g.104087 Transcript_58314/m.104087 type:complete len:90 (+) Transcript_58314:2859-3128(+)
MPNNKPFVNETPSKKRRRTIKGRAMKYLRDASGSYLKKGTSSFSPDNKEVVGAGELDTEDEGLRDNAPMPTSPTTAAKAAYAAVGKFEA